MAASSEPVDLSKERTFANLDAERAVLGGLFLDNSQIRSVSTLLRPEDFYRNTHARLFKMMIDRDFAGHPVDMLQILDEIMVRGELESFGGIGYLSSLPEKCPVTENLRYYAMTVAQHARRRALRHALSAHAEDLVSGKKDVDQIVHELKRVPIPADLSAVQNEHEGLTEFLNQFIYENEQETVIKTGLYDFDRRIGGFRPGELVILAGRSGMGKSAFSSYLAYHAAESGHNTVFYQFEMKRARMHARFISSRTDIALDDILNHRCNEDELRAMFQWAEKIAEWPLLIDDDRRTDFATIRKQLLQRADMGLKPDVIFFDHLQNFPTSRRGISEYEALREATQNLKDLAKELNCCVVALCQLNRDCEKRDDKRPQISDLRGSGSIEQDADMVLFLYRDEKYNPGSRQRGVLEINIAKYRDGEEGVVKVGADLSRMRIFNLNSGAFHEIGIDYSSNGRAVPRQLPYAASSN